MKVDIMHTVQERFMATLSDSLGTALVCVSQSVGMAALNDSTKSAKNICKPMILNGIGRLL